ncbi:MAG: PriCT-2 domain-containing protein, partial [Betaproteobacteria bacterium]
MAMKSDDTIRAALAHVPANDRDTWLRMGMAVKSEMGDAGYPVWDEWGQTDNSYTEADARAVWRSIKPTGKITIGTLYHEAQRNGYKMNGHARPAPYVPDPQQVAKTEADEQREDAKRATAADLARNILAAAVPARADHPYLERKHVPPVVTLRELPAHEIARHIGYVVKSSGEPLAGRVLVVPVRIGDHLSTLEFIDEAGRKSALKSGAKAGGFWSAQRLPDGEGQNLELLLAEGVATSLSLLTATGYPCFAALSRGMLVQAANALKQRYPKGRIIICGDLGNGVTDAHKAAHAAGGLVAFPDFGDGQPHDGDDFNDLAQHAGTEAVKRAIANARTPDVSTDQAEAENATAVVLEGPKWPDALDEAAFHG